MAIAQEPSFDPKAFLAKIGEGRTIGKYHKNRTIFSQGDFADAVFYIQKGKVKVTVVSEQGKEAVVAMLGRDEFCGEGCLAGQPRRMATATAMTDCEIMRLEKWAVVHIIHDEPLKQPPMMPGNTRELGVKGAGNVCHCGGAVFPEFVFPFRYPMICVVEYLGDI